jgi:anti-sigma regulatory factor (Ser/Thr protein kinase)
MNAAAEGLSLSFESAPESVGAARRAVADYAIGLGMTEPGLGALRTSVSEASTNVVRHAYPSGEGTFEVEARPEDGRLTVTIRDSGVGLQPVLEGAAPCGRLGLGLISVLSDDYEIAGNRDGGTKVKFTLSL